MHKTPIILVHYNEDDTPHYTNTPAASIIGSMRHMTFITDTETPESIEGLNVLITPTGPVRLKGRHPECYYTYREAPDVEYDCEPYELWLAAHEDWKAPTILFCTRDISDFPEQTDDDGKPLATLKETPHMVSLNFKGGVNVHALNCMEDWLLKYLPTTFLLNCDTDNDSWYEVPEDGTILLTRDKKAYICETTPEGTKLTETDFATVPHIESYAEHFWRQATDPGKILTEEERQWQEKWEADMAELDTKLGTHFEDLDKREQAREAREEAAAKALPPS